MTQGCFARDAQRYYPHAPLRAPNPTIYVAITLYTHIVLFASCLFQWFSSNFFRQCFGGVPIKTVFEMNLFLYDNAKSDQLESTSGEALGKQATYFPIMSGSAWLRGKRTSNFFDFFLFRSFLFEH